MFYIEEWKNKSDFNFVDRLHQLWGLYVTSFSSKKVCKRNGLFAQSVYDTKFFLLIWKAFQNTEEWRFSIMQISDEVIILQLKSGKN